MEYMKEIVLNVAACIILINIVNMISVSSKIKKYIRLFCGFILIMVIITPGKNILNNVEKIFNVNIYEKISKEATDTCNNTERKIKRINGLLDEKNLDYINNKIEKTHKSIEKSIVKIKKNENEIKKIIVRLKTKNGVDRENIKSVEKDVKNMVCSYFNILEEQVEISGY